MKTFSIIVSGLVQGVFYRQSVQEFAASIGISGSVKNNPDGTVQIVATGLDDQLKKLVSWCQHGPPKARVASVKVEEILPENFEGFRIIR
jgi:acylphosphatase